VEVIYSGLFCAFISKIAVEEDVDAVTMSLLNGAHLVLFSKQYLSWKKATKYACRWRYNSRKDKPLGGEVFEHFS
jgi:hypothetical protein